jgi:glycosyltransferase involved in cell wall biosynthesis
MPELIADALVLTFTYGVSLRQWQESGMLGREWALYRELLPYYRKLVLLTYGRADDAEILSSVLRKDSDRTKIFLICNHQNLQPIQYVASLPARAQSEVAGCKTVVIKTNQMSGGDVAVRITDGLRKHGKTTALIARGGYLWTRFVAHEHGPHSQPAIDAAARERTLCTAADAVIGTTDEMIEDLAWRYGLDPGRTAVIPNYVLTDQNPVDAAAREKGYLLYAGQLIPRKRVSLLIDAMGLIPPQDRANIRLEIIGDGTERTNLETQAKRLDVPVTFQSRISHEQLLEKMRRCSIYTQASELEGHPKTILEAMATGAPVIAADAPGMDVIQHGLNGLRLEADPRLFAHAFTELLADEDWRHALGTAAANATRTAFALPAILQQEVTAHRRAFELAKRHKAKAAA